MSHDHTRRQFLKTSSVASVGALGVLGGVASAAKAQPQAKDWGGPASPVSISSRNGIPAVERAVQRIREGVDPVLGVVEGVGIVEADEKDMTVG
ncbi:MAG: twin-arginine translocation signal domain-containing protein, partial [Phycisphaerales bacterium]